MTDVLIIEDDRALLKALRQSLELADLSVITAASFVEAKDNIRRSFPGVILSDIRMPGRDGFDVLALARSVDEKLPVIFLTGEADIPTAVRAVSAGAWDFLEKPAAADQLTNVVRRALVHRQLVLGDRATASEQMASTYLRKGEITAQAQCTLSLADRMEAFEKAVLADTLKRHEGRASAVAKELQMPRKTLYDRLARHDLRPANYRPKS